MRNFFIIIMILFFGMNISTAENWVNTQNVEKSVKLLDLDNIYKFDSGVVFALRYTGKNNEDMTAKMFADFEKNKVGIISAKPYKKGGEYTYKIPRDLKMRDFKDFQTDFEQIKKYAENKNVKKCPENVCSFVDVIKSTSKTDRDEIKKWNSYMKNLEKRVKRSWSPIKSNTSKTVVTKFTVKNDGTLKSYKIVKSSGDKMADEIALHAIKLSEPFKPFPKGIWKESVDIEFTFNYSTHNRCYCYERNRFWAIYDLLFLLIYIPLEIIF